MYQLKFLGDKFRLLFSFARIDYESFGYELNTIAGSKNHLARFLTTFDTELQ